ncbi:MAG TPA: DNA gyrase inhibitor YacG [Stellaceae bacterium]|nr:DNA gyrase inhibitor YacG [Stellaceae bacterium]
MSDGDRGSGVRPCPICGKPAQAKRRPFCSARCALIDLGRWLNGDYRVPTDEAPEDLPREEREE